MPRTNVVIRVEVGSADEDRVRHAFNERGVVVVLADGAGGLSGGRRAAETVLAQCGAALSDPAEAVEELRRLDAYLDADAGCGESTAVLVVVRDGQLFGASVGDSGAWLLASDGILDLTRQQQRKPLLGSGAAAPVGFGPVVLHTPADGATYAYGWNIRRGPRGRMLSHAGSNGYWMAIVRAELDTGDAVLFATNIGEMDPDALEVRVEALGGSK